MNLVFLILKDSFNDEIRLNINHIISYRSAGQFTEITTTFGLIHIQQLLSEFEETLGYYSDIRIPK